MVIDRKGHAIRRASVEDPSGTAPGQSARQWSRPPVAPTLSEGKISRARNVVRWDGTGSAELDGEMAKRVHANANLRSQTTFCTQSRPHNEMRCTKLHTASMGESYPNAGLHYSILLNQSRSSASTRPNQSKDGCCSKDDVTAGQPCAHASLSITVTSESKECTDALIGVVLRSTTEVPSSVGVVFLLS